eukprot:Unigene9919_Nuclearia_a/m.30282 Unigene9919_Nuclearia_a/g.30282  ORF Unigene9919_Nuclearia_a/g.30282 Unigene9919_Nuclearia_a/m.30282 type:complete len:199 (-) Unigene9919_Nuclearia_a:378-974(-)
MPAFFNGVFGHKPSPAVVPNDGQHPLAQNEARRYCTTGPICRYAKDLWPLLHVLKDQDVDLGDLASVDLSRLRVLSIAGHPGNLLCQSVTKDMEDAQTRVLHHLLENVGMTEIVPPREVLEALTRSFDIWSAMVNAAADPTFTCAGARAHRRRRSTPPPFTAAAASCCSTGATSTWSRTLATGSWAARATPCPRSSSR